MSYGNCVLWIFRTDIGGIDNEYYSCYYCCRYRTPIYAICTGAYAGKDIKKFWVLPVITALFFLAGAWWFFELGESDFILYALVYLILGMAAMLLSQFVRKKRQKNLSRSNGTPIK